MYNHTKIEKKWQEYWEKNKIFKFKDSKDNKKYYSLDMFPYPSGKGLHVGHPKGYTATDIISRYKKLNGYDVLHPIGWDAFGLPAEQYAIDTNNDPNEFTEQNINNFRKQLKLLGFCFDYDKEVNTTDPKYFKWTQWIFIQLYKNKLAELKDIEVNWCENLGTVLSNEEVLIDANGNQVSERGSHPVIKKSMKQWVLKITKYADKLLEGLDELDWPESLKNLQRNWIGKTTGYLISLNNLDLFTTKLENLNNNIIFIDSKAEFLDKLELKKTTREYINNIKNKNERFIKANKNYKCIKIDEVKVKNPLNDKEFDLFICDFINVEYNQKIICLDNNDPNFLELIKQNSINSSNLEFQEEQIKNTLKTQKININKIINYKLRDWLFSRQRYWGEPFPIYFDKNNNIYCLEEKDLPLVLPKLNDFKPSKEVNSPLEKAKDWVNFKINDKQYKRETNTMPQWAGSCWYYLAYILKQDNNEYIDLNSNEAKELFKKWLPVDLYIGGQEHAVLHLLYARFWHRFLYDIGVVPTKEPFQKIINQGMILGPDGEKMSKSKGNIINPDDIINMYGADTLRLYEMFMGPLTSSLAWDNDKLLGMRKWLDRVYRLFNEYDSLDIKLIDNKERLNKEIIIEFNQMVNKITKNLDQGQFNLAISNMMIFINCVYKNKQFYKPFMKDFLIILSTFAPHLSEELYFSLNLEETKLSTFLESWPKYEEIVNEFNSFKYPIIINNKPRDFLEVPNGLDEEEIKKQVISLPKIIKYLENKEIKKIIIIKNKVINIVI